MNAQSLANAPKPLPVDEPVPPFNAQERGRNIISYSLWGTHAYYHEGAVLNSKTAPFIYPEWTCRFYCDPAVPAEVMLQLQKNGAQIVQMEKATPETAAIRKIPSQHPARIIVFFRVRL